MPQRTTAPATPATRAETTVPTPRDGDPTGGIALGGRNKTCARARALAGMVLTSGVVVTLGTLDTSVSAPGGMA
ncbi:hypothetical protein [Streptomyces sp. ST2-7A]|uniref:hypothetical protein n=1 Tax=Streptomyces sp. ST2-7A TaxID=2907214 RepID=UPI001F26D2BF|nr:hypothetical protein [Streptomyces sp. ST2-7A]MCE7082039.1 hypothetical protein [Streptomyces sp. ST2-7A]